MTDNSIKIVKIGGFILNRPVIDYSIKTNADQ